MILNITRFAYCLKRRAAVAVTTLLLCIPLAAEAFGALMPSSSGSVASSSVAGEAEAMEVSQIPAASDSEEWKEFPADSLFNTLEELDVVAVKYGTDFRRDAVSGNKIDTHQAERLGVTDVKSFSGAVPNFHIPDYGSRITSTIYVRGIGARMDQPAVGLTVDNVGLLNKDAYDFDIADIASMEMLRGPQSSLFGRNTMTGLINVRTLSPMEFTGWRGTVMVGLNSLFRCNLGWYHRFNDRTGLAVIGSFNRYAGHFENQYNHLPTDREVGGSLRVKFHWQPSRRVTIENTASSSLLAQGGYAYASAKTGLIDYNDTCYYRRFLVDDGLSVRARLGDDIELLSVSSFQYIDDDMTLDQDFTALPYFTLTQKKRENAFTEDIMLKGKAGEHYSWLAGAYGFYRRLRMSAPVTFKHYGISSLIEDHRNDANPYYPILWNEEQFLLNSDFRMPSYGLALYHESKYEIAGWKFTGAIRFDYENIHMRYDSYCNTSYSIYKNPSGILPADYGSLEKYEDIGVNLREEGRLKNSYFMVLPKITVMKSFAGGRNVYLSVGKGYKAGGFNTQMFSDVLQQKLMRFMGIGGQYDVADIVSYKPEKSWNYEIGTHLTFLDGKILLDASVFYIDCRDQQLTRFPEGQTTGRMMTNAGKTRSFGGEISLNCTPLRTLQSARFLRLHQRQISRLQRRAPKL